MMKTLFINSSIFLNQYFYWYSCINNDSIVLDLIVSIHKRAFLFFLQESFLEYVCSMMSGTGFSNFFDAEAKESIAVKLRSDPNLRQSTEDSVEKVFEVFKSRVRQNLHVVFSTSPFTDNFHERCRLYPGLVNYSTVDWFDKWPHEALSVVARRFLADDSHETDIKIPVEFLGAFVSTHTAADEMCARLLGELGRHFHVTPKSFLDFILLFKEIYSRRKEQSEFKLDRLRVGLSKLEQTNAMVLKMQDELLKLGPVLEQKTKVLFLYALFVEFPY